MYKFKKNELDKEKTLWQVFVLSTKIHANYLQQFFIFSIFIFLYINAYYLEKNDSVLINTIREWSSMGFSFSITTLGFLITGFAIFTTVSKPKMMLAMMEHYDEKHKMPTLKRVMATFMKVFIGYIVLSIIYVLIIIFGQENGLIVNLFSEYRFLNNYKCIVIKSTYVLLGTSFIYLLFLLKSFIFNIYITVMTLLKWEYAEIEKNNDIKNINRCIQNAKRKQEIIDENEKIRLNEKKIIEEKHRIYKDELIIRKNKISNRKKIR